MDIMTILSTHPISFDPVSIFILCWLFRLESVMGKSLINAARREGKLDELQNDFTEFKSTQTMRHNQNVTAINKKGA